MYISVHRASHIGPSFYHHFYNSNFLPVKQCFSTIKDYDKH